MADDVSRIFTVNSRALDLTGQRFGRLFVDTWSHKDAYHKPYWICTCDCGTIVTVRGTHLVGNKIKSCGCWKKQMMTDRNYVHGRSDTVEYDTWAHMGSRCNNSNDEKYDSYGGRGVRLLYASFSEFYADIGPRPSPQHSVDRIDNSGHYEKGNCRWATPIEQSRNRRSNRSISHNGLTKTIVEWAEKTGIKAGTIAARIDVYKWSVHDALTTPVR